jgi:hypothetical protein
MYMLVYSMYVIWPAHCNPDLIHKLEYLVVYNTKVTFPLVDGGLGILSYVLL